MIEYHRHKWEIEPDEVFPFIREHPPFYRVRCDCGAQGEVCDGKLVIFREKCWIILENIPGGSKHLVRVCRTQRLAESFIGINKLRDLFIEECEIYGASS